MPRPSPILLLTALAILALGILMLLDSHRESEAALEDFTTEQSTLAREAAAALTARLDVAPGAVPPVELLRPALSAVEIPGRIVALLQRPGTTEIVSTSGSVVHCPTLEAAFASGAASARLERPEAEAAGLPHRLAFAGLATAGQNRDWKVAVVATASRLRDREYRSRWRLGLGFGLISLIIGAFGLFAQRKQGKEIVLARSLATAEAARGLDERLVRADKLATLGALATGIAHEVSTPLGVIVGRAEQLLPKVTGDERATKSVNDICEQAERITTIVRAFLRLARGGTTSLEKVAPDALARAAYDLVEHRFTKAGVTLQEAPSEALPRVSCDPRLFEQVIVNLLLNACDACALGGNVELRVEATEDKVRFIVTDDGSGITAEVAARATEPFFTTKPEDGGTGLGLAIANEIVNHHRGVLSLTPRKDAQGTRAVVELAAVRESENV